MTRSFYQGALGAVVVLDVNKHSSIQEAANWAADIHKKLTIPKTTKFPMILLGNKGKLISKTTLKFFIQFMATVDMLDESRRDVIKLELENLAKNNGFMGWWLVSAKDAYNLERPFSVLMKKIFKLQNRWPAVLYFEILLLSFLSTSLIIFRKRQSQVFPPELDVLKPMYDEYERNFKQQQITDNQDPLSSHPQQIDTSSSNSIRESNEFDEFEREDEFAEQQDFGEEDIEFQQNTAETNELPTPDSAVFANASQNNNLFNSSENNLFAANEDENLFADDDSTLFATENKEIGEDELFKNNTSSAPQPVNNKSIAKASDELENEFTFEVKKQDVKEIKSKTVTEEPIFSTSVITQEPEKFSDLFPSDTSTQEPKSVSDLFSKPSKYSYNSSLFDVDDPFKSTEDNSSANDSIFKLGTSSSTYQRKSNFSASKKKTPSLFEDDDLFGSDDKSPLF